MTETPDTPVHLTNAEAAAEYEATVDFLDEAINELLGTDDELPTDLRTALTAWYRTTDTYAQCVADIVDEAATR